jgi:hypothetical protein
LACTGFSHGKTTSEVLFRAALITWPDSVGHAKSGLFQIRLLASPIRETMQRSAAELPPEGPLGENPFPKEQRLHSIWAKASRYAAEELEQLKADVLHDS